jgi:predicted DNA-binding protein (MmcQ/YjbR family)
MKTRLQEAAEAVREFALRLPGAVEEYPWGERVAKVNKKIFVFLGRDPDGETGFQFSVKLPSSGAEALASPGCEPTGYGLGKSGWVTVKLGPKDRPDVNQLLRWVEESYRAVAPKKLVAELDAEVGT